MLSSVNCLLFDMDGTLTKPALDFEYIKQDMQIPSNISILEYIDNHATAENKKHLFDILDKHEVFAAENTQPNDGFNELMHFLNERNFKIGVLTRNSKKSAKITLNILGFVPDLLISREDSPYKPKPDAILKAIKELDANPEETLMIGDFKYDVIAGRNAGCFTCFITNYKEEYDCDKADFIINTLADLPKLLKNV